MARNDGLEGYLRHLERYGPEGILAAARGDLSDQDYEALAKAVQAAPKPPKRPSKRRRSR